MAGRTPAKVEASSDGVADPPAGSAERILRQVAAWLLPGAAPVDPPSDPAQAALLVARATSTRLLGPLLAVVDAGSLELPDHLLERAVDGHRDSMLWCVQVESRLLEVSDWFHEAGGVDFLVVKGPAVAHLDEPEPSLRSFADLDLLVRAGDIDRALTALGEHGAVRRVPERRPGFDRRFGKSVGLKCPDDVELDVHRTLCVGAFGLRIPLDDLFAGTDSFDVGGEPFRAPRLVHRALHAAYHATIGAMAPDVRSLRDLAGYMTSPDISVAEVVDEARRWRGETILASAVAATVATFSFDAPAWQEWVEQTTPDPREVALIRRYDMASRWPIDTAMVREMRWSDRAAFTRAVVFPSPDVLSDRGLTPLQRARTGLARLWRDVRR